MFKFMFLLACVLHGGRAVKSMHEPESSLPDVLPLEDDLFSIRVPKNAKLMVKTDDAFDCAGKRYGFYPDVRSQCKVVHVCHPSLMYDDMFTKFSFYCGGDTAFDQRTESCNQLDIELPCFGLPSFFNFRSDFSKKFLDAMYFGPGLFKNLFPGPFSTRRVYTTSKPPVEVTTVKQVEAEPPKFSFLPMFPFWTLTQKFQNGLSLTTGLIKPTESTVNRRVDVTPAPEEEQGSGMDSEPSVSIPGEETVDVTTMSPMLIFPNEMAVAAGAEMGVSGVMGDGGEKGAGGEIAMEAGGEIKNSYRTAMILKGSKENVKGADGYGAIGASGMKTKRVRRDIGENASGQEGMGTEVYLGMNVGETMRDDEERIIEASDEMGMDEGERVLEEKWEEIEKDGEEESNMSLEIEPEISDDDSEFGESTTQSPVMNHRKKRSVNSDSDVAAVTEPEDPSETTTSMPGDIYLDGMLVQHDVLNTNPVYLPLPPEIIVPYSKFEDNSDEDDDSGSDEDFFTTPSAV